MASPPIVVLMGVTGAGKTTVGRRVAELLGVPFVDADDFHDAANVERMRRGQPLDDELRRPWLDRLNRELRRHASGGVVLACSALKRSYRDRLARGVSGVRFVLLTADHDVLEQRIAGRAGHFAGADLLPSQLATLEPPAGAEVVDTTAGSPEAVADEVLQRIRPR